jgi:hypothetical protein
MSRKISAKDLHYDTTLPPFLARLHGQAASNSDGPDPLLARNRRHGKPRSGSAEAEDAPLVVDNDGNVVQGLKVGADGVVTETEEKDPVADEERADGEKGSGDRTTADKDMEALKDKEKTAGIGAGKKRKVGKVVGTNEEGAAGHAKQSAAGTPAASKKKKAKKIKLSFGDDDN